MAGGGFATSETTKDSGDGQGFVATVLGCVDANPGPTRTPKPKVAAKEKHSRLT